MGASSQPRYKTFKAGAAIAKGSAVKFDSDDEHVIECSTEGEDAIGVAQGDADAAEDAVEVALPGGGGLGLAGEAITRGKLLIAASDGDLLQTNTEGDRVIGMAMESASAGDLFGIEVLVATAHGADD